MRPIKPIDMYRRYYQLGLRASAGNFLREIVAAAPPKAAASRAAALPSADELRARLAGDPVLGEEHTLGSNAYGIGSQGARGVRSLVLGNPHFPWQGSERWYEIHLTVPGKLDAIGAALQGVPAVNIGFNKHVAWSHTVSTARRFTPYELKLKPGDPTSYIVDGKAVKMKRRTVKVGSRRHTFYETRWGPVLSYPAATLTWTNDTAYALGDVNAKNFRLLQQWFEYDRAKSVGRPAPRVGEGAGQPVGQRDRRRQGAAAPTTPTTRSCPNVDAAKQKACSNGPKAELLLAAGSVILLDGSRKSCAWGNDKDAAAKGILGPKALPARDPARLRRELQRLLLAAERALPPDAASRASSARRGRNRLLRTRLGLVQAEQRLAGTDGLGPAGFTLDTLQQVFTSNRNLSVRARPARPWSRRAWRAAAPTSPRRAACSPPGTATPRPTPAAPCCGARRGASWRTSAFRGRSRSTRPTRSTRRATWTPRATRSSPRSAGAVDDLRAKNIPLDVPLGELQAEPRGAERIGIPGCSEGEGCFNIISTRRDDAGRYDPYTGSSFVMTAGFDAKGRPFGESVLTYSQSENPRSPHYADQTRLFSQRKLLPMRFTDKQIKADPEYSRSVVRGRRG